METMDLIKLDELDDFKIKKHFNKDKIINKLINNFQERMKRFFPECDKEIMIKGCNEYIANLDKDNVSWKPIIEKYIKKETGRDKPIIILMIEENERNGVYDDNVDDELDDFVII